MVVRPLYTTGQPHGRYNVDPTATFEAGQVGMLATDAQGNTVVTLAGSQPFGIIDDNKTVAFTQPVFGELHTTKVAAGSTWVANNANLVSGSQLVYKLSSTGVATPVASPADYTIAYTSGIFTVVALGAIATAAPYLSSTGSGPADSIHVVVQYQFAVPGVAGADSTLGSGLVTLHFQKGEFAVSVYDTAALYAVGTKLFVGDGAVGNAPLGTLTISTRTGNTQCVGAVTMPPSSSNPLLTLVTDFDLGSWS